MSSARNAPHTASASVRQLAESACASDALWAALTVVQGQTQLLRRAIARSRRLDPTEIDRRLAAIEAATRRATEGGRALEERTR